MRVSRSNRSQAFSGSGTRVSGVVGFFGLGTLAPFLAWLRWRRSSAGQLTVGQALACDLAGQPLESLTVAGLAGVEAEGFLVEVAEQVERLDADVGALDGPLEQRPEVLDSVGVNLAIDVLLGVVNDAVNVLALKAVVADPGVGNYLSAALRRSRGPERREWRRRTLGTTLARTVL